MNRNSKIADYKDFPIGPPTAGTVLDPDSLGYIYIIGFEEPGVVKIGSAVSVGTRMAELQCGNPFELRLHAAVSIYEGSPVHIEFAAHRLAGEHRIRGEWFALDGDEALALVIKAARNAKARFGAQSVAMREAEDARLAALADGGEDERRRLMRTRMGIDA